MLEGILLIPKQVFHEIFAYPHELLWAISLYYPYRVHGGDSISRGREGCHANEERPHSVPMPGIDPGASAMSMQRSTIELHGNVVKVTLDRFELSNRLLLGESISCADLHGRMTYQCRTASLLLLVPFRGHSPKRFP